MTSAPLLSLFLLDETKFLGNEAHYVMALYDRSDPSHPYVPLGLSHNIWSNRLTIINELQNFQKDLLKGREFQSKSFTKANSPLEGFKKYIGHAIRTNLHMSQIFDMLWKRKSEEGLDEICIVTNDPYIPWEWAYNKDMDEFFCEAFSYGKLFFEYIGDYYRFLFPPNQRIRTFSDEDEVNNEIQGSQAILLYDDWEEDNEKHLRYVRNEIESIRTILKDKSFVEENICSIDGANSDAESMLLHHLSMESSNIKIIHFSGHIGEQGIWLRGGPIEAEELGSISSPEGKLLLLGRPVVFLNGCHSGTIIDAWEHQRNLSTAFMRLGASGIVCSHCPLPDEVSAKFAEIFYTYLLQLDESVGLALRKARNELREYENRNRRHSGLTWLFYTLYGDPSIRLFPRKTPKEVEQESYQKAREFDEVAMLKELQELDRLEGKNSF